MSSTDRNQKLKNYHARKVRERQLQLQLKKENVENAPSAPSIYTQQQHVGVIPRGGGSGNSGDVKEGGGGINSTVKSRSSRSLFATSPATVVGSTSTAIVATTNTNTSTAPNSGGAGPFNNAGGYLAGNKTAAVPQGEGRPLSSAMRMKDMIERERESRNPIKAATTSSSSSPVVGSSVRQGLRGGSLGGKTKVAVGAGGDDGKSSDRGGGVGPSSRLSVPSSSRMSTASTTTAAPPTVSTFAPKLPPTTKLNGAATSTKLNNNNTVQKSYSFPTARPGSSTDNATTTNNASAAARMFAARRRRAQLEMSSGDSSTGSSGSVASVGGSRSVASAGGGRSVTSVGGGGSVGGGSVASIGGTSTAASSNDIHVKPNLLGRGRESVDSIRSKATLKSVESRSTSLKSGGGGGTSRKAYERYVGSSSSGGGSVSSFDGGSSKHRGGSNNSSGRSSSNRPSSAPITTASTNNNRGGINTMNSMDSTDNSTIASAPSVDYGGDRLSNPLLSNEGSIVGSTVEVGDTARRAGLESLATVREVS
eukprot:scaffold2077_cov85-Skeletonema_dohrnii-CCMP3373.AAC.5